MIIAEFVELTSLLLSDVRETVLNRLEGVFADGILVGLGGHEAGNDFIIGLTRVHPEFHEPVFGLFPDPDGNGLHIYK